ncbi:MAG TPA: hypothetical protein VHM26_03420 [Chitinophagaceae bacterium]|jgi:hypothetical protein|nr:hypothetical protein [Chitinophagaceae bacterium]
MKKINAIAAGIVLLSLVACKKENETSTYNHVGFWRGTAYLTHIAMTLKANGNADVYALVTGTDTASAGLKGYGRYTVTGSTIRAYGITATNDTIFMHINHETNDLMTGLLYTSRSVEAAPINLWRQ